MKIEVYFIETINEPLFYNFKLSTIIKEVIDALQKGDFILNLQNKETKINIYTLNHKKMTAASYESLDVTS